MVLVVDLLSIHHCPVLEVLHWVAAAPRVLPGLGYPAAAQHLIHAGAAVPADHSGMLFPAYLP